MTASDQKAATGTSRVCAMARWGVWVRVVPPAFFPPCCGPAVITAQESLPAITEGAAVPRPACLAKSKRKGTSAWSGKCCF